MLLRRSVKSRPLTTFVASIVAVFVEVHRVLKPTGTVWLNMGDVYGGYDARGVPKIGEWDQNP